MREGHVHFIALGREAPAQPGPSIGGAGRTRRPLPDPFGIALLVAGPQRQMQPVGEREGVFGHQRGGHVAVVTAGVVVGVGLVVRGQAQVVPFPAGVGPFEGGALAGVAVAAGGTVLAVRGVGVHVQPIFVGVVIEAHPERVVGVQARAAHEIDAVLVPVRPAPVAHGVALGGPAGVDRIALLAPLAHIAQRVFIGGIGRQPQLERQAVVGARGVGAAVARVGGRALVVPETVWQREGVGIQPGRTQLVVPALLPAAQIDGCLAGLARTQAQTYIALEGPDRLAGDEVDGTAQGVGAIEQRGIGTGHSDLGQVEGGEVTKVHVAVVGNVQGHPIDEHRDLTGIEAAQVDHFLVAPVARQAHTRQQAGRVGHGVGVVAGDGLLAQGALTGCLPAVPRVRHRHGAQCEHAICGPCA